jgi:N-acyl-D-aspartate/D-glutamate deacylase
MHDLVVRGGTIVDGSGGEPFAGDVAVDEGVITEVGRVGGRAAREVDADGALVTPGFVDVHAHYDGQATWDTQLAPSSWHGVTTVVMGNCSGSTPRWIRSSSTPYGGRTAAATGPHAWRRSRIPTSAPG